MGQRAYMVFVGWLKLTQILYLPIKLVDIAVFADYAKNPPNIACKLFVTLTCV
jgi:hypothetical protein